MKVRLVSGPALIALAAALSAGGAMAHGRQQSQPPPRGPIMVPQPTPDADALASEMRVLASNPKDVNALVSAGELTLKLGDPTAAAVLFSRAEKIDPHNARMKAGMAAVLVRLERPGEALRLFGEAEKFGLEPRQFAAERGLAYDLIGQQERAQRDYRLALMDQRDDETVRRYALSLGISGKREEALEQIDPLLRKSDRAAWRDRAFILAMSGDSGGAEKIAKSMMPQIAGGLQPFFDQLPSLPATDRAFAVHFGEIRATPQRLADARLAPQLAALQPEPKATKQLAAAETTAPAPKTKRDRRDRGKRDRDKRDDQSRVELASANTTRPTAAPTPTQAPPTPAPVAPLTLPKAQPPKQSVATASPPPQVAQQQQTRPASPPASSTASTDSRRVELARADPKPGFATSNNAIPASSTLIRTAAPATAAPAKSAPVSAVSTSPASSGPPAASEASAVSAVTPKPAATVPSKSIGGEDSILAKIVAGITIPASELGVAPAPSASPVATPGTTSPNAAPSVAVPTATPPTTPSVSDEATEAAKKAEIDRKAEADRKAAEKKAADEKAAADRKAAAKKLADKKAADKKIADKKAADTKAAAVKKAAEEKKAKAEAPKIYVQVAGGANEHDLPKAWAKVKAKAPAAFKGKQGWSTPLNATNRVLAGPFASNDAAQSFVNALAKEGVSGFTFTSAQGQKIEKLPAK